MRRLCPRSCQLCRRDPNTQRAARAAHGAAPHDGAAERASAGVHTPADSSVGRRLLPGSAGGTDAHWSLDSWAWLSFATNLLLATALAAAYARRRGCCRCVRAQRGKVAHAHPADSCTPGADPWRPSAGTRRVSHERRRPSHESVNVNVSENAHERHRPNPEDGAHSHRPRLEENGTPGGAGLGADGLAPVAASPAPFTFTAPALGSDARPHREQARASHRPPHSSSLPSSSHACHV